MVSDQTNMQAILVEQAAIDPNQMVQELALFNPDGTPYTGTPGEAGEAGPQGEPGVGMNELVTTATAIATAEKVTADAEPAENTIVPIKFTNGNSVAAPTVAFDGGAARAILLGGTAPGAAEITVAANGVVLFFFDGTVLHQFGVVV